MRWYRYRLGAWLLRPYLVALHRHYTAAAKQATLPGTARNCDYIAIGLMYAGRPSSNHSAFREASDV